MRIVLHQQYWSTFSAIYLLSCTHYCHLASLNSKCCSGQKVRLWLNWAVSKWECATMIRSFLTKRREKRTLPWKNQGAKNMHAVIKTFILQECMCLSKVYCVAASTVQFLWSTSSALRPKSHLSVIHEMRNYPFRVLHCELNYMDLNLHACLSYSVFCNAPNSFDVVA